MRWSTRPESVITTSSSRAGVSATTSRCRTLDVDSVGYCTTATCRVSCASSRTARRSTSSRSTPDSRNVRIARPLRSRQRLDVLEPVDELAVALLGGHPARAGVRLGDVALGLQHRHVVAHGRTGHAQVVPLDQRSSSRSAPWSATKSATMARSTSKRRSSALPIVHLPPASWHPFYGHQQGQTPREPLFAWRTGRLRLAFRFMVKPTPRVTTRGIGGR